MADEETNNKKVCYKRKLEDDICENVKKRKTETSFLVFSDDILLIIISNLNHNDIISLSSTCERLSLLCQDHTLWRDVYFPRPTTKQDFTMMLTNVGRETKSIVSEGFALYSEQNEFRDTINNDILVEIGKRCKNLNYFSLKRHYLDCSQIRICDFPKTLTKLDLSFTIVKNEPTCFSYFKDISKYIPDLEVLILSNCYWFEPHSLMALSKCPKLVELRLNGCSEVKDCVAYCGLATRGGFKSLKTLDLRNCPIGSSELICFASVSSLVNLYLENPVPNSLTKQFIDSPLLVLFTKEPMIEIRADGHPGNITYPRLKIERLVIRHYTLMHRESLVQLGKDALSLKYLDLTGSVVSEESLNTFKEMRPDVHVLYS